MNIDDSAFESPLSKNLVKSVTKAILIIASVIFLAYLAAFLPGTEHLVPLAGIDGGMVMGAVLTALVVGLLVYLSSALARLLELVLDGPTSIVEQFASIVRWLVILAAVIVTHIGLSPLMNAVLGGASWAFDIGILIIALPVLAIIAFRMYLVLDPAAKFITDRVTKSTD